MEQVCVCVQKESTLKVIRLVSPTVHSIKFYSKIPGTFGMYLVCIYIAHMERDATVIELFCWNPSTHRAKRQGFAERSMGNTVSDYFATKHFSNHCYKSPFVNLIKKVTKCAIAYIQATKQPECIIRKQVFNCF
jgi:hypothetical protein